MVEPLTLRRCAVALLLAAVFVATGAEAATRAASKPGKEDLAAIQKRIRNLQESLEKAEGTKAEVTDALRESERAISESQRKLSELGDSAKRINHELEILERRSGEASGQVTTQRERVTAMLRQQAARGEDDALRILLRGGDPAQMQRDLKAYRQILTARQEAIRDLQRRLDDLTSVAERTREQRRQLEEVRREQSAQNRTLQREKSKQVETIARLGRDIDKRRGEIETLRRDEARLTKLIEQLAALKPPPRKERPKAAPGQPPIANEALPEQGFKGEFASLRGRMRLPVRGEVINRFGSPRADTGLAWKGLMIRADAGSPVLAVAPGRVAYADWLRGFGNLLIIDHGDGFMSLYGNNEALLRQAGETVASGETVARVGNSGGGDGPGLYFELRRAGSPIDPLAWVGR